MGESFNYIEVLCRVGSATMTVSGDWGQSIGSVKKYADMLAALDYNTMFAEAQQPNAKKTLERWSIREVRCCEKSICFLPDPDAAGSLPGGSGNKDLDERRNRFYRRD